MRCDLEITFMLVVLKEKDINHAKCYIKIKLSIQINSIIYAIYRSRILKTHRIISRLA